VAGFCEYGNEPSVSIEVVEILEKLGDFNIFKKGSASWS
jgi:hypothetical protein